MKPLQVFLFGPPRLERDGRVLAVNRRKMLALLAYLLITGQPHSRDALATLFWPDFDASSAHANLRRDLSRLKEILGERFLSIGREKVQVSPAAERWVDVAAFETSVRQAGALGQPLPAAEVAGDCERCLDSLEEAARLYSADFMAGFSLPDSPDFDEWQFFQTERLRELLAGVLMHLAHRRIAQAAYKDALEPARRWVALDPLHEPAQRLVMQLYAWAGQPTAALRQYHALVELLEKELGVAPEDETTALYEAIRTRRAPLPGPTQPTPPERSTPTPVAPADAAQRYQVGELLSSGGFGEIYLGRDLLTGGEVAIKRLRPQPGEHRPSLVERFLREGEVLGKLSHPNIVPLLDFYERDGQYNLVMAYMPGGTLRALLDQEQSLPLDRVLEIALELADALGRAHHLHILHRDLKPENVLMDAAGHPRLIDFGLALLEAQSGRLTQPGMLMGSPAYMSPEALRGQELDARSDIWSFGVLLFEMLSGRLPFKGEQFETLVFQITNQPAPLLRQVCADIPAALESLVARMLEKDPQRRLPSMRQAAAELEAIRSGRARAPGALPSPGVTPGGNNPDEMPLHLVDLPAQSTPLVGRETDLAHLHDLLRDPQSRLVTLIGPGGIGKTRLAIEAAARAGNEFTNGAVFVPLAPAAETEFFLPAIANALHVRYSPGSDPKVQLLNRVRDLNLLLVLDNIEHLLSAADLQTENLLSEILAAAPQLRLLVTSRERINLVEEWVYEVGGLPYPPPGRPAPGGTDAWLKNFSAVQLFVERARRARPDLELDDETLDAIIRICQLVEGMPLALELAAPWVRAMTCKEIAQELEHGMDLLTTSMRNLPDRHRSMRAVFNQSWQALSPEEQAILARLSVFQNGCTREAAVQVTEARPANLMALVDKALLRHRGKRYEMHELVRQYAAGRLAAEPQQQEAALDRHHRYYLEQIGQVCDWLKGGRQVEASQKISADIDNIRAAWQRAVQRGDGGALEQAAEAYWLYNEFIGLLPQGEAAFRQAAEMFPPGQGSPALAGFLRVAQGSLLARQWHFEPGLALMEQGLKLLREASPPRPEKLGFSLAWYSFQHVMHGQFDEAAHSAKESLAYYPQSGDRWSQAGALRLLGAARLYQGQLLPAQAYLDQSVEASKSIGELRIRTYATSNLGVIHLWLGQMEQAGELFKESLRISISCNDRLARADALCERGRFFLVTGDFERAIETARSCIHLYEEMGRNQISLARIILGEALRCKGAGGAEEAIQAGLAAARAVNHQPDIASGLECLGNLLAERQAYDQAAGAYREALEIWTRIGNEPEMATVLCRSANALLAAGSAGLAQIRDTYDRALHLARRHQAATVAIAAMVGLEAVKIRQGDAAGAGPLLWFALQHPATHHETRARARALIQQAALEPGPPVSTLTWQQLADRFAQPA